MHFTLLILSSIFIGTVNGWGSTGHSLVARIAQGLLTEQSQNFVRDHLPWYTDGNLSMVASWADTILYPDTDPDYLNWQWSKTLHFVNTPNWICNYDRNRDCDWDGEQRCVDGAIQNYTTRLANRKLNDVQREEALKFLVHFIGDVHQPLHGGFADDRGGNNIRGTFFGRSTNLHSLWDTLMIERRISADFNNDQTEYYNYLINLMQTKYASNISQWSRCPASDEEKYSACSKTWIEEDSELNCQYVYRDEDDQPLDPSQRFSFSQTYYNTRIVIAEQRLIQSGLRLSVVINQIAASQKHKKHKHDDDDDDDVLCTGTILFFVVIFLQVLILFLSIIYCLIRRRLNQRSTVELPPVCFSVNDSKI